MRTRYLIPAIVLGTLLIPSVDAEEKLSYNRDVRPILSDKCFHCHGPDSATREPEDKPLRLDIYESAIADRGGYNAITPGEPDKSEMIYLIFSDDESEQMPPPKSHRSLTDAEKKVLRQWVKEGAVYEKHWSFVPPKQPTPPAVKGSNWPKNDIDRFVLHRLTEKKLQPADQAEKTTLIRRATLSVTGLQPTPAEVDQFLADVSPDAYSKLLDRLLASPRYGENMAYGWIEASRYADTDGYQNDGGRTMWPWRDWVIKAFNDNVPYDQFSIRQLAGDMLPGNDQQNVLASAFNRNHRINNEGGALPAEFIVEYAVDRVEATSTVWMGLTFGCARCHDHKYDPISHKDFFRMYAYFNNIPEKGKDAGSKATPHIKIASPIFANQKLKVNVPVMKEKPNPAPTYLLKRGQYTEPDKSEALPRSVPKWLNDTDKQPKDRLELARWLVSKENPLAARVMVNRVWQHHFGTGLVKTADNFGLQGELPSHPDLLDWLATDFMDHGWDIKRLHKLILSSATWRQKSNAAPASFIADPNNRLLSRGPRFRLSATAIRDTALYAGGLLHEELGGPPVKPYQPAGMWKAMAHTAKVTYKPSKGASLYRRDLYTYWKRAVNPPRMILFDAATRDYCSVIRNSTNTPLQALTLMNDITFVEAARGLGERMLKHKTSNPDERLKHGFRLATGRFPDAKEAAVVKECWLDFAHYYKSKPKEAAEMVSHGSTKPDEKLSVSEFAAYMSAAHLMLNMDSTIHIE